MNPLMLLDIETQVVRPIANDAILPAIQSLSRRKASLLDKRTLSGTSELRRGGLVQPVRALIDEARGAGKLNKWFLKKSFPHSNAYGTLRA